MKFGGETAEGYRGEFRGAVSVSMHSIIMLIESVETSQMKKRNQ